MTRIECRDVSKTFTDSRTGLAVEAIKNLDMDVADEEIVTILGPSGCGKSSMLNLIAGF